MRVLILVGTIVTSLALFPGCGGDEAEEEAAAEETAPEEEEDKEGSDKAASTDDETTKSTDSTGAESSSPAAAESSRPRVRRPDLKQVTVTASPEWSRTWEEFIEAWTFTQTNKGGQVRRFYLGHMPPEAPTQVDYYAQLLQDNPDFQDIGYRYAELEKKTVLPEGWVILGKEQDLGAPGTKPTLGFVVYRVVGKAAIRCRGGGFTDPALRQEAVTICQSATL